MTMVKLTVYLETENWEISPNHSGIARFLDQVIDCSNEDGQRYIPLYVDVQQPSFGKDAELIRSTFVYESNTKSKNKTSIPFKEYESSFFDYVNDLWDKDVSADNPKDGITTDPEADLHNRRGLIFESLPENGVGPVEVSLPDVNEGLVQNCFTNNYHLDEVYDATSDSYPWWDSKLSFHPVDGFSPLWCNNKAYNTELASAAAEAATLNQLVALAVNYYVSAFAKDLVDENVELEDIDQAELPNLYDSVAAEKGTLGRVPNAFSHKEEPVREPSSAMMHGILGYCENLSS